MSMTTERWQQVKAIALDAWDLAPAERSAHVTAACGSDADLLREVESLLTSMGAVDQRFENPSLRLANSGTALRDVADAPPFTVAGGRIGGWRVVRLLGRGGMGTVYLVERADAGFTQRAALKVARGGFADELIQKRFLEERRILATLEHPDIARLIDGGATEDGVPYVVMEFVDGVPIDTYCRDRALGLRERLELFRRVCAVVRYAHQRLIVHRDLKAANILVTADGTPRLLDFGIAKLLDTTADTTQTLMRMVTPDSASPEQIHGATITTATDVYALGVLLYRLLTGEHPHGSGRSEAELIRAICEDEPRPPSTIAHDHIPFDVDVIVMKALRKEPERRYGSVEQLSEDLKRYLDGRPVRAVPDSRAYRAGKFVRRHRLGVGAAVALVVAVAGGIGATLWQARAARQERERADALRARAERQFSAVRGLASAVLGEVHEAVVALPGSMKAREILVRRATEYLDTLRQEAAGDPQLIRELAIGYRRLAQAQGGAGMPNLGDRQAAARGYRAAVALLESAAGSSPADPRDRIWLAETYVQLRSVEDDPARKRELLQRSRELIDGVDAAGHADVRALDAVGVVWEAIANDQIASKDLVAAEASRRKALAATETALRLEPQNLDVSRNVSLNYKSLGGIIQALGRHDEALALYERAMALDADRVARQPQQPFWKLDLSFAYGSMAGVLAAKDRRREALVYADKTVALREEVVALDPNEDFAKGALGRGYQRQGALRAVLGDVPGAVDAQMRRAAVYHGRLRDHPDREHFFREYLLHALDAAAASLGYLDTGPVSRDFRRTAARRIDGVLTDMARLRATWLAANPSEETRLAVAKSQADFDRAVARCRALLK
jgi:non-specific serine/threonine protein kinase/serine/threonine-protein kinase